MISEEQNFLNMYGHLELGIIMEHRMGSSKKIIMGIVAVACLLMLISVSSAASPTEKWKFATEGSVVAVSISSQGQYVVIGSDDGNIYTFRGSTGSGSYMQKFSSGGTNDVSVTQSFSRIAVGSSTGTTYLYDTGGNQKCTYNARGSVNGVSISSNGKYIAVGSSDGYVYILDNNCEIVATKYIGKPVLDAAISPDGSYVVAGSEDNTAYLLNKKGEEITTYETGSPVSGVSVYNNGNMLAGCRNGKIYSVDKTGNKIWEYSASGLIEGLSFAADGDFIIAASQDGGAYHMNTSDGYVNWVTRAPSATPGVSAKVFDAAVSSEGSYAAYVTNDNYVYFLSTEVVPKPTATKTATPTPTPTPLPTEGRLVSKTVSTPSTEKVLSTTEMSPMWYKDTDDDVTRVIVSQDGSYAAAINANGTHFMNSDGTLKWYNKSWSYSDANILDVSMSSDGKLLAVAVSGGAPTKHSYYLYDSSGNVKWENETTGTSATKGVLSLSADGKHLLYNIGDSKLYMVEKAANGSWIDKTVNNNRWNFTADTSIGSVAQSSDAQHIAVGTYGEGDVYLLNSTGDEQWKFSKLFDTEFLEMSSDGGRIIAIIGPNIYALDRNKNVLWTARIEDIKDMSISSSADYVAIGSDDKSIYLLDSSGNQKWTYPTGGWVRDVSISPDGDYVTAISYDQSAYMFTKDGALLWSYDPPMNLLSVATSSDGQYTAVGSDNDKMYLIGMGRANLESIPAGASVHVDDELMGLAPISVYGLTAGNHTVQMTGTGYESCSGNVTITAGGVSGASCELISISGEAVVLATATPTTTATAAATVAAATSTPAAASTAAAAATATVTSTPIVIQPGFEIIFALVGMLAVAYLVMRKK